MQFLLDLDSVAQRVPYGYKQDRYGVKSSSNLGYRHYQARKNLLELAGEIEKEDNEVMVKNAVDPGHVVGVMVSSEERKADLIDHLVASELAEDRGGVIYMIGRDVKAEDFVHVGEKFQQDWWG